MNLYIPVSAPDTKSVSHVRLLSRKRERIEVRGRLTLHSLATISVAMYSRPGSRTTMPIFVYSALTQKGSLTHGEAMALSVDALRRDLEKTGLLVKQIKKKRLALRGRVSAEALLQFNQEFSALVRAGLSIPEALKLLQEQPDSPRLTLALGRVLEEVRQGVPLSQAFSLYPEVFDPVFITAVMTAEKTGVPP